MGIAVVAFICLLGIAVCAKTLAVLGRHAPWTSGAWLLTALYFIVVLIKVTRVPNLASWIEYAILAALTIAFVVAGVRDERQAEPWWWPARRSLTRAERRIPAAGSSRGSHKSKNP
jgi:hypothetical protein